MSDKQPSLKIPKLVISKAVVKAVEEGRAPSAAASIYESNAKSLSLSDLPPSRGPIKQLEQSKMTIDGIPLKQVLAIATSHLHQDIEQYIESYQRIAPVERKRHLLKMLLTHQDLSLKLVQLVKWLPWLRHTLHVEKALEVVNGKGLLFTEAADTMAQMNGAMQHYRLPSIPIMRALETMLGVVRVPHALQRLVPDAEAISIDGDADADLALFTRRVAMKTLEGIPPTVAFDGPNVSMEDGDWCLSLRVYPALAIGDGAKWHLESISCKRLSLSNQIKAMLQQTIDLLQTQSPKLNLTKVFASLRSCQRQLMLRKFLIDLHASFMALSLPVSLSKDNKKQEDYFIISSTKEHLSKVTLTIDSDGLICLAPSTEESIEESISIFFDDQAIAIAKVIGSLWKTWRKNFLSQIEISLAPYQVCEASNDFSQISITHKLFDEPISVSYDLLKGVLSIPKHAHLHHEHVMISIADTNTMKQTLKEHVAVCLLNRLKREDLVQVKRESLSFNEILLAFVESSGSYIHCLFTEDEELSYIEVRRFGNLSNPTFKYSLGNTASLLEIGWNVVNQRLQMKQMEHAGFLLAPQLGNHATDAQIWTVVNAPVVFPILRVQILMKPNEPLTLQMLIRSENDIKVIDRHFEDNSLLTLGEIAKAL